MRLIDAEILMEKTILNPFHSPYITKRDVDSMPTINAMPVVHGRWKGFSVPHWTKRYDDNGDPEYKNHNEYVCSICRRKTIVKEKFCPNCGARMDLEEQDATY